MDATETTAPSPPSPLTPRQRRLGRAVATAVALVTLLLYLATAAPGAWWGDGMELTCAAWTLGIPHPTGYPVYTRLGYAFTHLLRGLDPGRAMTIMSAAMLAVSCGLLILFFRERLRELSAQPGSGPDCDCGGVALLPAVGVALTLAFALTVWDHATFAEVYPFTYLIGIGILMLAWTREGERPGYGRAAALGALCGIGALNHYSIAALGPLALLVTIQWGCARRRVLPTLLVMVGVMAAIVAAGWLDLMLRARGNPPLNEGDPSTLHRLALVLAGGQFRETKVDVAPADLMYGFARWLRWWGEQWLPERYAAPWPAGLVGTCVIAYALAGLARLVKMREVLGWGLLAVPVSTAVFAISYHIPDIEPFFLIALPSAALGWILSTLALLGALRRRWPALGRGVALRSLPAVFALALIGFHYHSVDRSWDGGPDQWGSAALAGLPQGAIVMTDGDQDIYALWYQQIVLGKRPDVSIVGSNFIFQGWYQRYFEAPGRPRIAMRAEDRPPLEKWTFDEALVEWVLNPNFKAGRRIFVTYDDPVLQAYFSPQRATAPMLPSSYYDACAYPFGLPLPVLGELHANAALAALNHDQLTEKLTDFYRQQALEAYRRQNPAKKP